MNPSDMNRFARAYERALFPLRRPDTVDEPEAPAELDVAIGAGWYRLVCAVEALVDGLAGVIRRLRAHPRPQSSARPIGCG